MKVRRVVTGHDEAGKSAVTWDSEIESSPRRPGFEQALLWATDSLPIQPTGEDPSGWDIGISLADGSVFRLARYEPGVSENWHRTDTIDYAIVLSGEICLQLEAGDIHLKSGDTLVQRATVHNWQNHGTEPCIIAFILIATEGGESTSFS